MTGPVFSAPAISGDIPNPRPRGALMALLVKWFFRQATVSQVDVLSEHFQRITLAGEALRGVSWMPGQKIQVGVGGNANRSYTPICWDTAAGETRILAFSHGTGPGAAWASTVQVRAACPFFGPRPSLDLDGSRDGRSFLFGDETAFGLALALCASLGGSGAVSLLFEVSSVEESKQVWQECSTQPAHFIARAVDDAHLDEVETRTLEIIDDWDPNCFILSGKASSIQRVRRALRSRGIAATQVKTKAYWAPGKTGLD